MIKKNINYSNKKGSIHSKTFHFKIMDFDLEGAIYEYTLNIVSIKMEVNFPCKMKI